MMHSLWWVVVQFHSVGGKLIFWETIIHYGGSDDIIASGRMKQDRQAGQDRTGLESEETRDTGQQAAAVQPIMSEL